MTDPYEAENARLKAEAEAHLKETAWRMVAHLRDQAKNGETAAKRAEAIKILKSRGLPLEAPETPDAD